MKRNLPSEVRFPLRDVNTQNRKVSSYREVIEVDKRDFLGGKIYLEEILCYRAEGVLRLL